MKRIVKHGTLSDAVQIDLVKVGLALGTASDDASVAGQLAEMMSRTKGVAAPQSAKIVLRRGVAAK